MLTASLSTFERVATPFRKIADERRQGGLPILLTLLDFPLPVCLNRLMVEVATTAPDHSYS
jgi:hypothetical protein